MKKRSTVIFFPLQSRKKLTCAFNDRKFWKTKVKSIAHSTFSGASPGRQKSRPELRLFHSLHPNTPPKLLPSAFHQTLHPRIASVTSSIRMSGRDEASEGSVAMEEDQDDDLYSRSNGREIKDEAMQQSGGEDEEEEDESDSVSPTDLARQCTC